MSGELPKVDANAADPPQSLPRRPITFDSTKVFFGQVNGQAHQPPRPITADSKLVRASSDQIKGSEG